MKPMSTDMSKVEKGEETHLLSEALVKPIPEEKTDNGIATVFNKTFGIKKPCKWIRCLCWTMAILTVVLIAAMITCALVSYIWTRHQVRRFTIVGREKHLPNPPLPVAPIPEAQVEIIKDEAKLFWDQLRAGVEPKQDLVISEEAINGLIAESDFLRGHALVTVEDGKWTADLALPAHKLPGGKGRFFVGKGVFEMSPKEEQDSSSAAAVNIVTQLTYKYPVRSLNYANLVDGKFEAYSGADGKPVMEMNYGQFLNWVAPDDFIAERENLLDCDFHEHCHDHHDHHHHHHHHHHDDDDDDHHHHHFHHHDHHHHHHDKEDCLEAMEALARLESVTIQDKKIIFKPIRGALAGTAGGQDTNEDKDEDDMDYEEVGEAKKLMETPAAENGEGGVRGRRFLTEGGSFSMMSKSSIARRILREVVF